MFHLSFFHCSVSGNADGKKKQNNQGEDVDEDSEDGGDVEED